MASLRDPTGGSPVPHREALPLTRSEEMRLRILDAATALLNDGGRDAVTTRAITAALHIQAPTIYRIFGDKRGLLDELALHGFSNHLASWTGWTPGVDPIESIRQGWDMHIDWGLRNPHVYSIAYGDPQPGSPARAAEAIDEILRVQLAEAAKDGLLAIPVGDAVRLLRAAGVGVVFTLLAMPERERDPSLSHRAREAALGAMLSAPTPTEGRIGAAMQLKHRLDESTALTPNERALLGDWLDRLAR